MSQSFYVPPVITHNRDDGTKNIFTCLEKLGQGGFAIVYKVNHQNTNKIYAMKIISKQSLMSKKGDISLEKLKQEIQIQKSLISPYIVQSKISFNDEFNYYIALEYCPGKNISEYIKNTDQGHLNEAEARKVLKDVLNGLICIHKKKIVHKDIKLENFLIGSDGKVKIADFGLATYIRDEKNKKEKEKDKKKSPVFGTPNYMCPEMLTKKGCGDSFATDIWEIGVSAFIMLTGKPPFIGSANNSIYDNIKNCRFNFPLNIPLSLEAKDFIKSILKLDPTKRPSALDLLKHPFMRKYDPCQIQLYHPLQPIQKVQSSPIPPQSNHKSLLPTKSSQSKIDQISPQSSYPNDNYEATKPNAKPQQTNDAHVEPFKKLNFIESKDVKNNGSQSPQKTFTIPIHFVVKHSFLREDMAYFLGNGTVGICFNDKSRIILDPNELFVQYYKSQSSPLEVYIFNTAQRINSKVEEKVSLVKKFARAFKKFKNLYDPSIKNTTSSIPLHHVLSFFQKDNSILYKFSNKDIQVNFSDGKKFIYFCSSKKMCISKDIREKCALFSQKDFSKMNNNSDEIVKFKKTKEMLNELAQIK